MIRQDVFDGSDAITYLMGRGEVERLPEAADRVHPEVNDTRA